MRFPIIARSGGSGWAPERPGLVEGEQDSGQGKNKGGGVAVYIPTHRKGAMDGVPERPGLVEGEQDNGKGKNKGGGVEVYIPTHRSARWMGHPNVRG